MKLSELDPIILEMLCTWQFFRNIGYTSEQIFVGCDGKKVFLQAQWRGLEYNIICGLSSMSYDELAAAWSEAADSLNTVSEEEFDSSWRASKIHEAREMVLGSLAKKGMYWPKHENFRLLN